MNYYVVLGIKEDADRPTIRRAFWTQARRYHPDAGPGSSSAEFRRIVEAYETLSDPERRRVYDRSLHPHRPSSRAVEPLGNRRTIEPLAFHGHSWGNRPGADAAYRTSRLDDSLRELFDFIELTFRLRQTNGRF